MFVKPFKDISKDDVSVAGGKGASLGEMTKAGIPVPTGFVVLVSAFERFLEEADVNVEIDSILHAVDHKEMHTVEHASEKIQALILAEEIPKDIASGIKREFKKLGAKFVAVRSSATAEDSASAAWAGQLDSFLNATEKDLLENVQRCWASLFTPRALFYRFEKGLHEQNIGVAVVVQKMVESEVSGIAFSVHPVTEDRNQMIIEAGFGLGEATVSGQITPDSYVVEKQPRRILDKNISEQERGLFRSSSSPQLRGGAESPKQRGGVRESNEWRSIPEEKRKKRKLSDKQILELSELILKIENHYGFPCDIEWAFAVGKFYVLQSRPITTLSRRVVTGQVLKKIWSKGHSVRLAENWCYGSLKFEELFGVSFPDQIIELRDSMGAGFVDETQLFECQKVLIETIKKRGFQKLFGIGEKVFESFLRTSQKLGSTDFSKVTDNKLSDDLQVFIEQEDYWMHYIWLIFILDEALTSEAEKLKGEQGPAFAEILNSALIPKQKTATRLLQEKLRNLPAIDKNFRARLKAITQEFSYFSILNMDEEPLSYTHFENMYKQLREENRTYKLEKFAQTLKTKVHLSEDVRHIVEAIEQVAFLREYRNDIRQKSYFFARHLYMEIGKRAERTIGEVVYCMRQELLGFLQKETPLPSHGTLASRRIYSKVFSHAGAVGYDFDVKHIKKEEVTIADTKIKGAVAFPGLVRGTVKVILNMQTDSEIFKEGDILIVTTTNLSFLPVFSRARAIVADEGGITSHAAITARELRKPCIIGTKIATKVLKDGDMVEVDADKGVVKILKRATG